MNIWVNDPYIFGQSGLSVTYMVLVEERVPEVPNCLFEGTTARKKQGCTLKNGYCKISKYDSRNHECF